MVEHCGEMTRARFGRAVALLPLRVRGIERVQLHADLTILTKLASRLPPRSGPNWPPPEWAHDRA